MDYMKQLKAYRIRRLACPLSISGIALYAILLEYANDLYFPRTLLPPIPSSAD